MLLQGYPDVELIVIDGGSTDSTIDVIARYEHWITFWVSERDEAQSQAYNKGLRRISGQLFNTFDTDDFFLPGAFGLAAAAYLNDPHAIITGDVERTWEGEDRTEVFYPREHDLQTYAQWWKIEHHGQPGIFYPSCYLPTVGLIREDLHYLMDYEFTLRYLEVSHFSVVHAPVAVIRHHSACKSSSKGERFAWECIQITRRYQKMFPGIEPEAVRYGAGMLFGVGCRLLLRGKREGFRFVAEGFRIHPFWAVYWVFPGKLFRNWKTIRSGA